MRVLNAHSSPHAMNLRPRTGRKTLAQTYKCYQFRRRLLVAMGVGVSDTTPPVPPPVHGCESRKHQLQLRSEFAPVFAVHFPAEVWRMILWYYPHTLPSSNTEHALCLANMSMTGYDPPRGRERYKILRSLSQTCRALRSLMLPLLWEEVETCVRNLGEDHIHIPFRKVMTYVLREYSVGLLRTPAIAVYVK